MKPTSRKTTKPVIRIYSIVIAVSLGLLLTACGSTTDPDTTSSTSGGTAQAPVVPQVSVNLAISPYIDQSESYIGVEKGFYKDVGITIGPDTYGKVVQPNQVAPLLAAGTIDFAKTAPSIVIPSLPSAPSIRSYAYSDLFLGFAIICQPEFKTVADFVKEGASQREAIASATKQLVGKTFAVSSDPGVAILYQSAFEKAGISLDDMNVLRVEDAQGFGLMTSNRADCQLPGAPIRVSLQAKGFVAVVTSADIAQIATTSDYMDLQAISQNGWATTLEYWEKNRDTVLRMASVGWRINDLINADLDQAIQIHVPYVNKIAGTSLTLDEGRIMYTDLDPFITFENQAEWFNDSESVYYQSRIINAAIKAQEEAGTLPAGKYTYKDISIAAEVYQAMLDYKAEAEGYFSQLDSKNVSPSDSGDEASKLYSQAKQFFEWRDYLDASRFAEAALAAAG